MTFNKHVWSQEKKHCQVRATEQNKKIKEPQNKLAISADELKSSILYRLRIKMRLMQILQCIFVFNIYSIIANDFSPPPPPPLEIR